MVRRWFLTDGGIFILQVSSQSSVKPVDPILFGDEDDDDLFGSAKPKAPPVLFFPNLYIKPSGAHSVAVKIEFFFGYLFVKCYDYMFFRTI